MEKGWLTFVGWPLFLGAVSKTFLDVGDNGYIWVLGGFWGKIGGGCY